MDIKYLSKVRKHFACGDKRIDRHNQRQWVRSVRHLGEKWLLAQPVQRGGHQS